MNNKPSWLAFTIEDVAAAAAPAAVATDDNKNVWLSW